MQTCIMGLSGRYKGEENASKKLTDQPVPVSSYSRDVNIIPRKSLGNFLGSY